MKKTNLIKTILATITASWLLHISYAAPFVDGDRVVFWGDSITHGGLYTKMLSDFYLTRYPDRVIYFYNAGVSGDNAGAAMMRFEDDIARRDPTVVTFMFGMNDSGRDMYNPAYLRTPADRAKLPQREAQVYRNYTNNMTRLAQRVSRDLPKARKMMLTPTPYDETAQHNGAVALKGTVATLQHFAQFNKQLAAATDSEVVDWNTSYQALVEREQRRDPTFTFLRKDRVHPEAAGHLFMTYEFLKTQAVTPYVSDVELDVKSGKVVKSNRAKVSDLVILPKTTTMPNQAENTVCTFTLLEDALPWTFQSNASQALTLAPIVDELNREILTIRGLKEGDKYTLIIDGISVGTWTGKEFAQGINLATNSKTPQFQQSAQIEQLNDERCAIERNKLRMFAASRWFLRLRHVNPDDMDAVKKFYNNLSDSAKKGYFECRILEYCATYSQRATLEADQETRWKTLLKLRQPHSHCYKIVRE